MCHRKDGSRWRHNLCLHSHHVKPPRHVTDIRKAETRQWCKHRVLLLSLSLCDFSQSRLLINYQIVNVKVIATPFHSGADKPAPINIPVSGCRSGRYDTHGLIPSLPYCCCGGCHVNLSTGGSQMSSKSASSTARGMSFNCLGAEQRDSVRSCPHFIICEKWGGSVKTVLMSHNINRLVFSLSSYSAAPTRKESRICPSVQTAACLQ